MELHFQLFVSLQRECEGRTEVPGSPPDKGSHFRLHLFFFCCALRMTVA